MYIVCMYKILYLYPNVIDKLNAFRRVRWRIAVVRREEINELFFFSFLFIDSNFVRYFLVDISHNIQYRPRCDDRVQTHKLYYYEYIHYNTHMHVYTGTCAYTSIYACVYFCVESSKLYFFIFYASPRGDDATTTTKFTFPFNFLVSYTESLSPLSVCILLFFFTLLLHVTSSTKRIVIMRCTLSLGIWMKCKRKKTAVLTYLRYFDTLINVLAWNWRLCPLQIRYTISPHMRSSITKDGLAEVVIWRASPICRLRPIMQVSRGWILCPVHENVIFLAPFTFIFGFQLLSIL